MTRSHLFSRAFRQLHVFILSFVSFTDRLSPLWLALGLHWKRTRINLAFIIFNILVPRGRAPLGQHQESRFGADQKERGLWEREWLFNFFRLTSNPQQSFTALNQKSNATSRFCCFEVCIPYSGYQSHAPFEDFFPLQKLSFGGRQSNVSMTMVVFISCQFHGDVRSSLDQV